MSGLKLYERKVLNGVSVRTRKAYEHVCSFFEGLEVQTEDVCLVGSTFIQGKETSDIDLLVLLPESAKDVHEWFPEGWAKDGTYRPSINKLWGSYKKEVDGVVINLLVTKNRDWFYAWRQAAHVCYYLHNCGVCEVDRDLAVFIHEIVRDGADWNGTGEMYGKLWGTDEKTQP